MNSSTTSIKFSRFSSDNFYVNLCKTLGISGLVLYLAYIFIFTQSNCPSSQFFTPLQHIWPVTPPSQQPHNLTHTNHSSPTNLTHLVFGLVGSVNAWRYRKAYIESWWRPNATRGYLFLDTHPTDDLLPWPPSSPPLRVSNDISKIVKESKHVAPIMARMVHAILEVFREGDEGVRWYVMGDDDSIFFVDNWVDILGKYDHTKYVYIGGQSEFIMSNFWFSFAQGFGGAGFALSYPLVAAMVKDLEGCLRRYPYLNSADLITKYCVDELGVPFSIERGIHQIDLRGDISGFLSSHPQSPLLSLHHFDMVEPIFPSMDRFQSTNHLMKAAKIDQSRMLQQTICYQKQTNWSFSISWGYSAHIYEKVLPRSVLKRPLETFRPWSKAKPPFYMFNTRWPPFVDPCEAPHVFFFESIDSSRGNNQIVTTYVRSSPRGLPACSSSGNHSADYISRVRVFSPMTKHLEHSNYPSSKFTSPFQACHSDNSPTNITHLVFGLVSSINSWKARRPYVESWWRPNVTRGYLFLDKPPTQDLLPWPLTSPPLRISEDYSKLEQESKHLAPRMIRMVLALSETLREGDDGVRWYVMGFDDSIFFVDNWVSVLAKYDHSKYLYIGGQAETILSNFFFSFEQGFGGAGIALSYPLAAAMVKDLEGCIRRYPYANSADLITQYCVDEFGVSFTAEKGIHQIDLRGDISGFLSAHPQAPLLSLHHFDYVNPIFPSMDRIQSTNHLMKAAKIDQSRLLQQTICYDRPRNWSFSVSWGYSAHIYEKIYARTLLKRPLETFRPWLEDAKLPMFMFNTRWPCEIPNIFFFESGGKTLRNQILTTYLRSTPLRHPNCTLSGNHFANKISKIQVFSSATKLIDFGRSECCDIVHVDGMDTADVRLRDCKDDEIIG
ncbi:hypothetical protein TEA_021105 [Camellia sinensis var. sinensis]|uniref:Uncharacterized protein n=1 Tax=Camellia sinensis var. sinensis TaxID=542762 RepID=A0A4S4DDU5_CAMSN|nr:hypothetical protein TEA_021105 [Camellia sinensis var. sinensis]